MRRKGHLWQPFGFLLNGKLYTGFEENVYAGIGDMSGIVRSSIESLGMQHNRQCSGLFPVESDYVRMPQVTEVTSIIAGTASVKDVASRVIGIMTNGVMLPVEPEVLRLKMPTIMGMARIDLLDSMRVYKTIRKILSALREHGGDVASFLAVA